VKIELMQKPKNATIIEGFPGFGLVSTIATEFLVKHLNAKRIGQITSKDILPMAAIHNSEVLYPLGIYYDGKHNIVIVHALSGIKNQEWDVANVLLDLSKQINAKEIISLEGVGSSEGKLRTFYYTEDKIKRKKLEGIGLLPLKEGIIMGVTGALMLKKRPNLSCIFVESKVGLADSKAAAKVIEVLDSYLGLKIDPQPLLKMASEFESKLKNVLKQSKQALQDKAKKNKHLDYFG